MALPVARKCDGRAVVSSITLGHFKWFSPFPGNDANSIADRFARAYDRSIVDEQTGSFQNAVVFPVTVLSALRTYYAGTALDFGEIGNITTASLTGTPQKTSLGNYVFVQSSGAYSVTLSSQNGFKLFKPGATVTNDKINYRLRFLGSDVDSTTVSSGPGATAISRNCVRATLSTAGNSLPIQATLLEGGQGKNPSPTYADVLTVTVTPLVYSDPGTNTCATYGL